MFDVADLIKDAIVLPWAFICGKENATEQEFRQQILQAFTDHKALDYMFDTVKAIALSNHDEINNKEANKDA
ncbi:CRISPR-associated endonuclease Cas1 [Altererythrobacter insulae]|nr:CRISPR-associated endonuclease Cas1 [Altererythrobacter insulae]